MNDLRKYARQTNIRLIVGAVLILFIVGDGLIFFIYGPAGALTGLLCIIGGMVPIAIVIGILQLMEYILKKNEEKNS
jgi:hypothetical protein